MKILIVDDDISIRNVLRISLESKAFSVDLAEDGEQGSFMARSNDYDLIILDNVLPKKMGGHVCKEIRESGKTTPILMLSSKKEVLTKVEILNDGADDYMTKPFSFEELLARMNCLIRRPKGMENKIIKIKNLSIDRSRQIVILKDKEVYLTKKEYALLEFLIVNRDTVVSRGQLLEHVWESSGNPFSNTIETHILSIRRKIGDKRKSIIESIPSRGYRFNLS